MFARRWAACEMKSESYLCQFFGPADIPVAPAFDFRFGSLRLPSDDF